eukprot:1020289-Amphidinium_carterae.1
MLAATQLTTATTRSTAMGSLSCWSACHPICNAHVLCGGIVASFWLELSQSAGWSNSFAGLYDT